jgi:hypothetical protein
MRLLDVFPDACIIQTHRTPVKAMPSLASVMVMSVGMAQGTNTDPEKLARRDANYWALCAQRMMKARESIPVSQVFDVDHREFRARPMDTVRTIYRHFGLTLTLETEAAMKQLGGQRPDRQQGHPRVLAGTVRPHRTGPARAVCRVHRALSPGIIREARPANQITHKDHAHEHSRQVCQRRKPAA